MGDSALEGARHAEQAVVSGSVSAVAVSHLGQLRGDQVLGGPRWGWALLTQSGHRCSGRHAGWS